MIEDLLELIQPVITEHIIRRDYCPRCKQHVEPVVPDALPRATIGQHLVSLTSWLHYGLGVTIDQIVDILSFHLHTQLTPGGLINAWQRLAEILTNWYGEYIFTFLDYVYVPHDNNFGERQIRPAVILRKNSQ